MPIYEYQCRKCNTIFEILQNMNDDASKVRCPQCRADKAERIISLFNSASADSPGSLCAPGSFT